MSERPARALMPVAVVTATIAAASMGTAPQTVMPARAPKWLVIMPCAIAIRAQPALANDLSRMPGEGVQAPGQADSPPASRRRSR